MCGKDFKSFVWERNPMIPRFALGPIRHTTFVSQKHTLLSSRGILYLCQNFIKLALLFVALFWATKKKKDDDSVSIVTKGIQFLSAGVGCVTFTTGRGHHFTGDLPEQLGAKQCDQMELGCITGISLLTGQWGRFYSVGKFFHSGQNRHTSMLSNERTKKTHTHSDTQMQRACWVCCL